MSETVDFLIIGGGVVGLTVALELRRRHADASITVLEKEPRCGEHASGRNSGVLHAGFYYTPDSLKARLTRDGCRAWTEYCEAHDLPIRRCGKLVVTRSAEELPELQRLYERGITNGVELKVVDAAQAREIEPRAKTVETAIWSPTTASVNPARIMSHLAEKAVSNRIDVLNGVAFVGVRTTDTTHKVQHSGGNLEARFVINAAGLYADKIARQFGHSSSYRILPFRGTYLYGSTSETMHTNLYPVPDSRFSFLGVHFTVTVDDHVKIGPTAMPGLWREHYGGLGGFNLAESVEVGAQLAELAARDAPFRRHAASEIRKLSRHYLVGQAATLATGVSAPNYSKWGRPGIRAQLVDTGSGTMENDFVIESDPRSLHVLNAVSPAFTCAWPFAAHVVDVVEAKSSQFSGRA
jgi:L-2-hydroxyglutarate oxidase